MTIKNTRWVNSGNIYHAYFTAAKGGEITIEERIVYAPFGHGIKKIEQLPTFLAAFNGKKYAVLDYDHFNGHLSRFTDKSAIYAIKIAECY